MTENNLPKLYPMLFSPNLHSVVWGGERLIPYKGLDESDLKIDNFEKNHIGESWEVSAVKSSPSFIANGLWRGKNIIDVINKMPEEILGKAVVQKYGNHLPLLVKFIEAKKDLSIQVHPNDDMALREHGKFGKSEMWYVIDAQPDSYLYAGFNKKINIEEYKRMVADGTITNVLARHKVKSGDVFYLPAGRVHAICGGIILVEVQQSSDVTYRIYDYNRPGVDGKPRELHTELAAEALDFHVENEYRTIYNEEGNRANHIITSPYFSVRVTDINQSAANGSYNIDTVDEAKLFHRNLLKYGSFIISMCIEGDCKIQIRSTGDEIVLKEGNSCLIPATIADYDIIPLHRKSRILDAFIDNRTRSLSSTITRFLHITNS